MSNALRLLFVLVLAVAPLVPVDSGLSATNDPTDGLDPLDCVEDPDQAGCGPWRQ